MHLACVTVCLLAAAANHLSGAVKLQMVDGRPVVNGVFVNGHGPYRFLLDTGTTLNHIEAGLARSIGLTASFRTELTSSVGTTIVTGGEGIEVRLQDAVAGDQKFLFAGLNVVHQLASGIQGILGQEFLARFDYRLDLREKQLEFGRQERPGHRAAFRLTSGRPTVTTSLGELVIDSGAASVILFGVRAEGSAGGIIRTLAGSQVVGSLYRSLVIEGRRVWSGDAVAVDGQTEPGVAGLMPLNLFRSVYFCNSSGYAVFE